MNIEKEKKIMKIYDFITYTIMILMMILCLRHIVIVTHASSISDAELYYDLNGTSVPGVSLGDNFIIVQRNTVGGNSLNGGYYLIYLDDSTYDYKLSTSYTSENPMTNVQVYKDGSFIAATKMKELGLVYKLYNSDGTPYTDDNSYLYLSDAYVPIKNPSYGEDNGTYWGAVSQGEGLGDLRLVYCNSKSWNMSTTNGYLEYEEDFFLCPQLKGLATLIATVDLQVMYWVVYLTPLVISLLVLVIGWYKGWHLLQKQLGKA